MNPRTAHVHLEIELAARRYRAGPNGELGCQLPGGIRQAQ